MPKRNTEAFDGSAAREIPPVPGPRRTPSRAKETRGESQLPEDLAKLQKEQAEETKEVSGIRERIRGERKPNPGVSAVLAIEHAKSVFGSGALDAPELERTQTELVVSKQLLENAVAELRARGADQEAINEYYGLITDVERLLDIAEQNRPEEVEELFERSEMESHAMENEERLSSAMRETSAAKRNDAKTLDKQLAAAEAALEEALLDRGVTDSRAEQQRLANIYNKGGWSLFKLRASELFRGGPSVSTLYEQIRTLRLKKDALEAEAVEANRLAGVSAEKGEAPSVGTRRGPKTSQAELRRESERREARQEAEALYGRATEKSADELEKEYLGDGTDDEEYAHVRDEELIVEREPVKLKSAKELLKEVEEMKTREAQESRRKKIQKVAKEEPVDTSTFVKSRKRAVADMLRDTATEMLPGIEASSERERRRLEAREGTPVPPEERTNVEEFEKSLEEEEPIQLVRRKEKPAPELKLPKEILERATEGAKKLNLEGAKKTRSANEQIREIFGNLNVEDARKLLPNASELWDLVSGELRQLKTSDAERFGRSVNSFQMTQEAPQTKFVFEAARLAKARKAGADERTISTIRGRLQDAAGQLGIHDAEVYRRATDPEFNDAMNLIPHSDQFVELINRETGLDESYHGVSEAARNYIAALGAYRKAVESGDTDAQNAAWEIVNDMNTNLGISGNALVQSVIGNLDRPKSVLKGVRQRQEAVRRANRRWGT